jgi:starvation-inducible DNA-binding protein
MDSTSPSGFTEKARDLVRRILEQVLLDESQLAAATRGYVWRVRRSPVQSLVRLFAEQGRQIDRWLGDVSEQARTIGLAVRAPFTDATAQAAAADEIPSAGPAVIGELLAHHERLAKRLRAAVGTLAERDDATDAVNLLHGLLEFHETTAWMLRLVLEAPEARPARALAR